MARKPLLLAGSALGVMLCAAPALADLVTIGSEFRPPARMMREDREGCRAGDGTTARAEVVCESPERCTKPMIHVKWFDRDGNVVAGPVIAGEAENTWVLPSLVCSKSGSVLVLSLGRLRVVSPAGPLGPVYPLCPDGQCGQYESMATPVGDGFFLLWIQSQGFGISGRFVTGDGSPDGETIEITTTIPEGSPDAWGEHWVEGPDIAADGADRVVAVWRRHVGNFRESVRAVLVDRSGRQGDEIALNQSEYGDFYGVAIHKEPDHRFVVTWSNHVQAGWVGRRITTADNVPTTTTTTTTLDARVPEFLPATDLASLDPPDILHVGGLWLAADGAGHWMANWREGASSSRDDARRWAATEPLHMVANDDAGRWVSIWDTWDTGTAIRHRHSDDGGETWSEAADLYRNHLDATWHGVRDVRVAAGSGGRWVATWFEWAQRQYTDENDEDHREDVLCGVRASISLDRGETWEAASTIAALPCYGDVESLNIATDGSGNWIIVWGGAEIVLVRSNDDASRWSPTTAVDLGPGVRRPSYVDIATDGAGNWIMPFHAMIDGDRGNIYRVFVSRSADVGATWSAAAPLTPWQGNGDGLDFNPSIAFADGRWGIAWESYSGVDANGLDADIMAIFSTDAGASWSAPRTVDRAAATDDLNDYSPRMVATNAGAWGVLWGGWGYGSVSTVRFARSRGTCGNGIREETEECDDGNEVNGDGCDDVCLATGCGNTVVTEGEECDDGNQDERDGCLSGCNAAVCGDGFVYLLVEQCDDGNDVDTDGCLTGCKLPICGDGIVQAGVEECDDLQPSTDWDDCRNDCRLARCGDGAPHPGVEECDDGNLENGDRCTRRCRIDPVCMDTSDVENLTATQALSVLRRAVGIRVRCPIERCDVDGNGRVTVTDALRMLQMAVGARLIGDCAEQTLILRLTSPQTFGALQLHLDFGDAQGDILPGTHEGDCVLPAIAESLAVRHLDAGRGHLNVGVISRVGFHGPLDVIRCRYRGKAGAGLAGMTLEIPDATNTDGEPMQAQVEIVLE